MMILYLLQREYLLEQSDNKAADHRLHINKKICRHFKDLLNLALHQQFNYQTAIWKQ